MKLATDAPVTMDWRDFALWSLFGLPTTFVCWAGNLWRVNFESSFIGWTQRDLVLSSALTVVSLLLAPILVARFGGITLGRAFARGVAVSTILIALTTVVLSQFNALGWQQWALAGSAGGLALGVGWMTAFRRFHFLWLIESLVWGVVAGLISTQMNYYGALGLWFGGTWACIGLHLAWILRRQYLPDTWQRSKPPAQIWRVSLPSLGILSSLTVVLSLAALFRPCAPLRTLLEPASCVQQFSSGDFYTSSMQFSMDGKSIFLAGGDFNAWGAVDQWNWSDGVRIARFPTNNRVRTMAVVPSGEYLVALDWSQTIYVWRIENQQEIARFPAAEFDLARPLLISPDSRYVAGFENIYEIVTGRSIGPVTRDTLVAYGIPFPSSGGMLVWSPDQKLQTSFVPWDDARLKATDYSFANDIALIPADGELAGSLSVRHEDALQILPGPIDDTPGLAFSPDGAMISAIYGNRFIDDGFSDRYTYLRVWRVADGQILYEEKLGDGRFDIYAWSPHDNLLALLDMHDQVRILQIKP